MGLIADKVNMFGKAYNTVGSSDSNFIIKTKGDVKIQWGGKYIDLIKNGKVASSSEGFIYQCTSEDEIKKDGLYLLDDLVLIRCKDRTVALKNSETAYISYLEALPDITTELKLIALTNIGFYYNNLEEAKLANMTNGIVFIVSENKLYTIKDGTFLEYLLQNVPTSTTEEDIDVSGVVITEKGLSLNINSNPMVIITTDSITMNLPLTVPEIFSDRFSIKSNLGKSILEIDTINWKDIQDSSIIGTLSEARITELLACPETITTPSSGIYSSNFIGLNSKLYDPIFKKRCDFPKYDESITIPEIENLDKEEFNTVIPSLRWIKELISIIVPPGTIVMWSGKDIPKGWAICDGTNGTPNLIGKFIKADKEAGTTGGNNNITLSESNLPNHTHTISGQTTSADGDNTHNHEVSGLTITSTKATISDSHIVWKTVPTSTEEFNKLTNITTVVGTSLKSLHGGLLYLDSDISTSEHAHSVSTNMTTTSDTGENSHTHTISDHFTSGTNNANNNPFSVEPEYYSLIFIIKL